MVDLDYLFASKEEKQKIDLAKKQQKEKELQERLEKDKEVDPNVDFNRNPFMYDLKEFDRKKFICLPYKREIDRILKQNYHADASQELDALYENKGKTIYKVGVGANNRLQPMLNASIYCRISK